LPKKSLDNQATHKWTLFVRGPNDEDLSCFVSKIAFSLHQSFAEPVRIITNTPFEVTASGWGEFEAGIRIFFKDPTEQPIDLLHVIKLYHPENTDKAVLKKPVMKECYDEIVFTNPNPHFKRMLLLYTKPEVIIKNHLSEYYTLFDENPDLQKITDISAHIKREIEQAKMRFLQAENEYNSLLLIQKESSGDKLLPNTQSQEDDKKKGKKPYKHVTNNT
jgi:YEATS domain-containing protein 4